MKRFVIIYFLVTLLFDLAGQVNKYGVPFVKNYSTQITQGSEQNWCITEDIFGNMYFGNQDRGVVRYDGTKWSAIQIGSNPGIYSLATDNRGIVYVGGIFELNGTTVSPLKGGDFFKKKPCTVLLPLNENIRLEGIVRGRTAVVVKQKEELLDKNLMDWMGESTKIDDILVLGIRT